MILWLQRDGERFVPESALIWGSFQRRCKTILSGGAFISTKRGIHRDHKSRLWLNMSTGTGYELFGYKHFDNDFHISFQPSYAEAHEARRVWAL